MRDDKALFVVCVGGSRQQAQIFYLCPARYSSAQNYKTMDVEERGSIGLGPASLWIYLLVHSKDLSSQIKVLKLDKSFFGELIEKLQD